jgi:hypothetical protein
MYLGLTTWPVLANAITVPVLPGGTGRRGGAEAEERGHSRASEEVAQRWHGDKTAISIAIEQIAHTGSACHANCLARTSCFASFPFNRV